MAAQQGARACARQRECLVADQGLALSSAHVACAHSEEQRAPQQPCGAYRLSQITEGGGGESPEASYALARPRCVSTRSHGTDCAKPTNSTRRVCGGSEARVTWHRNVRPRLAADEGLKRARRPLFICTHCLGRRRRDVCFTCECGGGCDSARATDEQRNTRQVSVLSGRVEAGDGTVVVRRS